MKQPILFFSLLATHLVVIAQTPISDNSFLIEEAYNQEAGVVQHIVNFLPDKNFQHADGSFTQEWPVCSQRHQFSYMIPFQMEGSTGLSLNDLLINYRYQIVAEKKISIAPRFSVLFPTGKMNSESTTGLWGYQVNLPLSVVLTDKIVLHGNVGQSLAHSSSKYKEDEHLKVTTQAGNYGISFIYQVTNEFNLMCEAIHLTTVAGLASGIRLENNSTIISPGLRFAVNLSSGMQIVPGFAVPYDLQLKEHFYFLYLSVEHAFKKIKS